MSDLVGSPCAAAHIMPLLKRSFSKKPAKALFNIHVCLIMKCMVKIEDSPYKKRLASQNPT